MAFRGDRFQLDLGRNDIMNPSVIPDTNKLGFVQDIIERDTSDAPPPAPPRASKSSETGAPAHKKRLRTSRFKQLQNPAQQPISPTSKISGETPNTGRVNEPSGENDRNTITEDDRKRIDEENRRRMAQMSPEELEHERQELLSSLPQSLIARLLRRAPKIDDGRDDYNFENQETGDGQQNTNKNVNSLPMPSHKKVTFDTSTSTMPDSPLPTTHSDAAPAEPPSDLRPAAAEASFPPPQPSVHFPRRPATPPLDPSDPDFLENLHTKYFPSLPADPSKLAWMAPIPTESSPADLNSPYHPSQSSLPPSSLRFDFRGCLIPPRLARQIPTTAGLHHHGLAPEAAGYTVPELAILARSAVPAQRCIAYQTLGRIMYRLGDGVFGEENGDLYKGLQGLLEEGRVLDIIMAEAGKPEGQGHATARALAIDALWLWRKAGGKRMGAS